MDTADIEQTSGAGAQLAAGGDVDLIAEDALRIEGSDVAAGNNVRLEGTTVDILASRGDYSEVHDGEQIGGEAGITAGGEGGTLGYYVEVEGGQNDLVRDDQQHRNSHITAGERLEVVSTDDTTISGANLTGNELDLDVGGDLLVSSVQDEGAVDGQRWDGKLRVTVGAGVSVSGSAGYGETEGEKAWVEDQTSLIGRESVDIDTAGHTQVEGAVIANIREDGSDGGNLSLTTDTLAVTDIHDSHTEDSHYTRISGSWESEKAYQSRGSDSDYTQTTGKPRGDETGDTLDERTTWGIEGSYSSLDREQINRGTIGQGEITVHNPGSDLNTELADINRDIDRAQEITRDESETTELYVTETSVEDAANPVDTVNRWGEQLQNLPERYIELPQEVLETYDQFGREITALTHSAPEGAVAVGGEDIAETFFDGLVRRGLSPEEAAQELQDPEFQAYVLSSLGEMEETNAHFQAALEQNGGNVGQALQAILPGVELDDFGQVKFVSIGGGTVTKQFITYASDINAFLEKHPDKREVVEVAIYALHGYKGLATFILDQAVSESPLGERIREYTDEAGEGLAEWALDTDLDGNTAGGRYFIGGGTLTTGVVIGGLGPNGKGGSNRSPDSNGSDGGGSGSGSEQSGADGSSGLSDFDMATVQVDASRATRGTPEYETLNNPPANSRVELDNGTTFRTGEGGYVDEITYRPVDSPGVRDGRQTAVGKEGIAGDVGGHIQACRHGGTCDRFNLFPQDSNFNNSAYKRWENEITRSLQNGDDVGNVTVRFNRVDPYNPRPDSIEVEYQINGRTYTREFENQPGG